MKPIYNNIIPVKGFKAINLFGVIFVRNGVTISECLLNHERIHTRQIVELLFVCFYLLYIIEWLIKTIKYGKNGYNNISFEREAYENDSDQEYLSKRKMYNWIKKI